VRQLQLTSAAIVPHAPLLLDGIGPADPERAAIREATRSLRPPPSAGAPSDGEITVLLSAHGNRAAVYTEAAGSLDVVGIPGREISLPTDARFGAKIAAAFDVELIEGPLDHEAVVSLMLAEVAGPVVVACLSDITSAQGAQGPQAIEEGHAFARALRELAEGSDGPPVRFLASAHTGAALHERGPLGKRWSALELEEHVRRAIETDPSKLGSLAFDLWLESGSCGSGVFAALADLVTEPGEVKAYAAPRGVGYIVASFATSPTSA
jgi:hypothetical protein